MKLMNRQCSFPRGIFLVFAACVPVAAVAQSADPNWGKPAADGKYPRKEISYPYVFERRPGEIWLTAWRFGGFRVKLFEKDFIAD